MGFKIQVDGVETTIRGKLNSQRKIQKFRSVVKEYGAKLQDQIQTNMSETYKGHYVGKKFVLPTGATKRSVTVSLINNGMIAEVGPHTYYAPYLEFGTRYIPKGKYATVYPALNKISPKFISAVREVAKEE
ncbi:HK97 gp10 family phage protein [Lactobacillus jensenii]|jgi:hypothetical protein|uniref:Putative tail component n=1 Tax=Myoviridae sp. ctk251 TaxID=2826689 RepID=A0A8S5MSG5_9CAUD|nr:MULTISPECIES: HK97 gp10 family phage protein [Lactobacillus]DAD85269.1 MAG TPA: putative tail component [Myoviridae sp. ctk251]DAM38204.1 MAG TPA: putative tail component [Caudoviricetes sp.]EEX27729.1 phage protein, HK97 gp10 family [Lactobacillus jensenii SJ-7A-US]MCF1778431.1 HK97 gp10 family phage protein [Lactobacillus jensenii]MCF1797556.1 HK97 gp10 family phage protein [Lactobacillus mulieris]